MSSGPLPHCAFVDFVNVGRYLYFLEILEINLEMPGEIRTGQISNRIQILVPLHAIFISDPTLEYASGDQLVGKDGEEHEREVLIGTWFQ